MASQSLQELASLLPGGTYISFTVLAQLTTNTTDMAARLASPLCECVDGRPADSSCTVRYVCGSGYWDMSVALLAISAVVVCMLAWYGEDLVTKKDTLIKIQKAGAQQSDENKTSPASLEPTTSEQITQLEAVVEADAAAATAFAGRASNTDSAAWRDAKGLRSTGSAAMSSLRRLDTTAQKDVADLSAAAVPDLPVSSSVPIRLPSYSTIKAVSFSSTSSSVAPSSSKLQKQIAKHEDFRRKVEAMSVTERRRKLYELYVAQFVRTSGAVVIFLVLALFTPPTSTCILPPCAVPPTVCHVVPLLVSFAVSAFIAVQRKVISRGVRVFDWLVTRVLGAVPLLCGSGRRSQTGKAGKVKATVGQGKEGRGSLGKLQSELPA